MIERGIILDHEARANVNFPRFVRTIPDCICDLKLSVWT
jgi:hypothetical protein